MNIAHIDIEISQKMKQENTYVWWNFDEHSFSQS